MVTRKRKEQVEQFQKLQSKMEQIYAEVSNNEPDQNKSRFDLEDRPFAIQKIAHRLPRKVRMRHGIQQCSRRFGRQETTPRRAGLYEYRLRSASIVEFR